VGRIVVLTRPPRRIVSLAPSVTESLFYLGAGDRVVGVTDFCDYPREARRRPRIGGMLNPNWEAILNLRPDVVVATTAGNDRSLIPQAESIGIPLYYTDARDIEGILDSLTELGGLLGYDGEAERRVAGLRERIRRLEDEGGPVRPTVLYLVWADPLVVPGAGSLVDRALSLAGCRSISADAPAGWPTWTLEAVLLRQPQWILASPANAGFLDTLAERPGWKDLEAVRKGRVATVSEALERPSPRLLDAVEELRRLVRERP
jgi:iron complex transport system substrate-binding protein